MKKTLSIIIVFAVLVILGFFATNNFESDKQSLLDLKSKAANGDLVYVFEKMEGIESFSNPLINRAYQRWKDKMVFRFVSKKEEFTTNSGSPIVDDISGIYRKYWTNQLLKKDPNSRTDTVLYAELVDYILLNKLSSLSKDSLSSSIKNDTELGRIIEEAGFKSRFMYRNGFQDLLIWDQESAHQYAVILPKDTIQTRVIFIENYQLKGYDYFATFGSSQVGGWAIKESATLYCNKDEYDLSSEKFAVSYLKHESLHFTDLNQYPYLSATDLEYRSKLIELMYCTEVSVYDRISEFVNGAQSNQRSYSHPYANYSVIKNMSALLFTSKYEVNSDAWEKMSVEAINEAATILYNRSEGILAVDSDLKEII